MATKNRCWSRKELEDHFFRQGIVSDLEETLDKIEKINQLKQEKEAVILAHYYQRDAIKFGIADYVGDSLDLSKAAMETEAKMIVFCGVHFMAETAKILNPDKKVLLPSLEAGCSLAASITAEDVRKLREQYPQAAFVTYVNTTAEVKAEVDVCVTSANAPRIIAKLPQQQIVFLPDAYMGNNLREEIKDKEIIIWKGKCIVHEDFTAPRLEQYRLQYPGLKILAHYECDQRVIEVSDMHGGTGDMRRYIRENEAPAFLLATECGLASTIKADLPDKNIIGPCNLCMYMKTIDINNTLEALENEAPEIILPEEVRAKAYLSLHKMFDLGK